MFTKQNILFAIIILIVLNTLLWAIFSGNLINLGKNLFGHDSAWYAVHLNNGHVYFGRIKTISPETIILKDVYFLEPSQDQQSVFNLIKRSNRDTLMLTDNVLFINRAVVLFWEKLMPESEVVRGILRAERIE